jgi:hypothetical protein
MTKLVFNLAAHLLCFEFLHCRLKSHFFGSGDVNYTLIAGLKLVALLGLGRHITLTSIGFVANLA